ncbi:hypothetical protein FPV67DRAFT_1703862 [Lyophyllum atratum]|nr:hypothetical protein FPV67DRAFT_1703862 [Lyophyllum atratum]
MAGDFSVTFLGTSSGGGPSESRNCSSLVCNVVGDSSLWSAPQTYPYQNFYSYCNACHKWSTVRKGLFVNLLSKIDPTPTSDRTGSPKYSLLTCMYVADHIMGIVPFLRNMLYPPPIGAAPIAIAPHVLKPPSIEIYGPSGIRNFVRQIMKMTLTRTADFYVVHELLTPKDRITPCLPHDNAINSMRELDIMHCNEVPGQDVLCSEDGFWKDLVRSQGAFGEVFVDAGPISHRDPCLGYVIREASGPLRKLVILGDTHDPSSIATDAHIPRHVDYTARRTPEAVLEKALARGHSIPSMAGAFAKKIGAERLVLNHIGGRFPAPKYARDHRTAIMREIEKQATDAWGSKKRAVAAYDFMHVDIPIPATMPVAGFDASTGSGNMLASSQISTTTAAESVTMELHAADPVEGLLYAANNRGRGSRNKKRRH